MARRISSISRGTGGIQRLSRVGIISIGLLILIITLLPTENTLDVIPDLFPHFLCSVDNIPNFLLDFVKP